MSLHTRISFRGRYVGLALAAGATLAFGITSVSAGVLVSDNFDNATNNTTINGRTPDKPDTGTYKWIVSGTAGGDVETAVSGSDGKAFTTQSSTGSSNEQATVKFEPGAPGTYGQYTLSATIHTVDAAYIALGFVSDKAFFTSNVAALTATVAPNGQVVFYGVGTSKLVAHPVTIADFDSSIDHTFELIYNAVANTATVKVDHTAVYSNVALVDDDGNSYTPPLEYGGFFFRNPQAAVGNTYAGASVDDFSITATPEPASGALALLGLGGLALLRRKRCH